MHAIRAAGALLVAVASLAACRDDGRALAPAPTVPVSLETTTTAGPATNPEHPDDTEEIGLSSAAFTDGGLLHETFTCDGDNVPPPLTVTGVPPGAAELAIVVTDRDSSGSVHWAVSGIPPTVTGIESAVLPPEAVPARTTSGVEGWDGPCPPAGEPVHTYDFVVYATLEPIGMAPGTPAEDAVEIIEQAAVASGSISAVYASPVGG